MTTAKEIQKLNLNDFVNLLSSSNLDRGFLVKDLKNGVRCSSPLLEKLYEELLETSSLDHHEGVVF